jgi:GNAT superfamily N-acetyltransferase
VDDLVIRPVTMNDADVLFRWLNDADRQSTSLQTKSSVSWPKHVEWLQAHLADPDCYMAIAEIGGSASGQVRLDKEAGGFFVSIYVDARHRSSGVGTALIEQCRQWLGAKAPTAQMCARVLKDNAPSLKFFKGNSFETIEVHGAHFVLQDQYRKA